MGLFLANAVKYRFIQCCGDMGQIETFSVTVWIMCDICGCVRSDDSPAMSKALLLLQKLLCTWLTTKSPALSGWHLHFNPPKITSADENEDHRPTCAHCVRYSLHGHMSGEAILGIYILGNHTCIWWLGLCPELNWGSLSVPHQEAHPHALD